MIFVVYAIVAAVLYITAILSHKASLFIVSLLLAMVPITIVVICTKGFIGCGVVAAIAAAEYFIANKAEKVF